MTNEIGSDRVGKVCLVRSAESGVWVGTIKARAYTPAGVTIELIDARRVWSWTGAYECSALALTGPSGGNIGLACSPIVNGVVEDHICTEAALMAFNRLVCLDGLRVGEVVFPEKHDGSGSRLGGGGGSGDGSGYGYGIG